MKRFAFEGRNWIILIVAIAALIVGYSIMATGDKTISIIILMIAYLVLFPLSIMLGWKKSGEEKGD